MRILLVEDDEKAARLLSKGLREEGFAVDVAHDGDEGDELVAANTYDAIILDWLLPGKDGIAIWRELRARGFHTPILMLTARQALADRVTGLNMGADDYLTKPFAFDELLARIHALLRRSELTRPVVLQLADLRLDPQSHQVRRAGRAVHLTPKEYAILEVLIRQAGEVVSRARLVESVWEDEQERLTNLVDVHVSHLRRKIDRPGLVRLLHTVRERGFRLGTEG
jgi:two-component system, OmpR family, response regulator